MDGGPLPPIPMSATSPEETSTAGEGVLGRDGLDGLARRAGFAVLTTTWIAFWALVARIHLLQGDYPSAGFTVAAFVVPGVGVLAWTLGIRPDLGRPTLPDVVGTGTD